MASAVAPLPPPRYLKRLVFHDFVTQKVLATMAGELFGFNAGMIEQRTRLRHLHISVIALGGVADGVADYERHARWMHIVCRMRT